MLLEANRHLTDLARGRRGLPLLSDVRHVRVLPTALERLPATLAGIELRQSRFDHFKVSVQLIFRDLARSRRAKLCLLRHLRHVRVLHARRRDLPLNVRIPVHRSLAMPPRVCPWVGLQAAP
jgi:hypothetical protein